MKFCCYLIKISKSLICFASSGLFFFEKALATLWISNSFFPTFSKCGNMNYARRSACNKCNADKPPMPMGGMSYGGAPPM